MEIILKEKNIEDWFSKTLEEIGYVEKYNSFQNNFENVVIDFKKLKEKMLLINKNIRPEYIDEAINKIKNNNSDEIEGNFKSVTWIKEGIRVYIKSIDEKEISVRLFDFDNLNNNCFEYIRQLNITLSYKTIIPDIIIYINGLPISIIELKSPESNDTLEDAYKQICNYNKSHADLMYWNVFSIVSNSVVTRYGSTNSGFNHWYSWKRIDINSEIEQDLEYDNHDSINNYKKNIVGILSKNVIVNLIKNYIFFAKTNNKYTKYIPAYHQYFAVEKSVRSLENSKNGMGGVVWHTQGSGKSVTMLFLASRIKSYFKNKNYKLIYITDRNELDDQLYKRFCEASETYLFMNPKKIESRIDLIKTLSDDDDFGIYMTTIQKFTESNEPLSTKDNIIIIADEAHRSHNNIEIDYEVNKETREIVEKEGYAKFIRDAFPNATFIGFTGTPLMGEKKTTNIFGDYIDKYTMNQAVLDGSTVPIHYEKRQVEIILDRVKLEEIDDLYEKESNPTGSNYVDASRYEFIKKKLVNMSNLLNDRDVIRTVVADFWNHYNARKNVLNGKAMFVAFNRNIAFEIYKEMIKQNPIYKDQIKLIVTRTNKDSQELSDAIPSDDQKREITIDFKKDNSKVKIAIVVDMWLTGFDVPDLDTIYIFKIIKWHNLMQTIARVNRTYSSETRVKQDGLVVDYIGIWKYISDALKQYSDHQVKSFDIDEVVIAMVDKCLEVNKLFFSKTDLIKRWIESDNNNKYDVLVNGIEIMMNHIEKDKFFKMASKISRWFKLCSQSKKLLPHQKLEAQFYLLLRNFIRNQSVEEAIDVQEMLIKLKQKMDEIITTGGIEVSTISLSGRKDLAYVSALIEDEIKNLNMTNKISSIKVKTIENEVKNQINELSKVSPLKAKKLSDDLIKLVAKFEKDKNANEFLSELIQMAKLIAESKELLSSVGDETVQTFYSILADDKFKMMNYNSETLKSITLEIMEVIKKDYTPQWWNNPTVRNKVNSNIKGLLGNKYNYPPKECQEILGVMMNEIDNTIKKNKEYFTKEEDL